MRIRFGEFVLDGDRRLLERRGDPVHLSPKAFALLAVLVEERPRAVAKRVLLDRVWPDVVVEEQNVKNAIVEIRAALGPHGASIRTVQRFGYAFEAAAGEGTAARLLAAEREYALFDGENVIGRDAACSVVLAAKGVSRRHAAIHLRDGRAVLEDLGSKNGTWRNEERLDRAGEIHDGDVIRVGVVRLTFRSSAGVDATTTLF